jgi:hypothetical protein
MSAPRLAVILAVSVLTVVPAVARQQPRLSKQDSDRFEGKLTRIVAFGNEKRARAGSLSTPISEAEVNAYFEYAAKGQVPPGIVEPRLNALGEGRVGGQAVVDLDAVRKQKQRGWLDPMAYLTGSLPLTASGLLITKDGVGRFQLESAQISGVSVPKSLLQELLAYYSRTPENPRGISMDDPFELPAHIREIRVDRGQATILQ